MAKDTKKTIEALKEKLTHQEALMYRCWKKRILVEESAIAMSSDNVKRVIDFERVKHRYCVTR